MEELNFKGPGAGRMNKWDYDRDDYDRSLGIMKRERTAL